MDCREADQEHDRVAGNSLRAVPDHLKVPRPLSWFLDPPKITLGSGLRGVKCAARASRSWRAERIMGNHRSCQFFGTILARAGKAIRRVPHARCAVGDTESIGRWMDPVGRPRGDDPHAVGRREPLQPQNRDGRPG